ncbi:MAG: DUF427 domain-containing protein [Planctomycetota bacterium]
MAKAMWNGATVAESDDLVEVEGNQYFPMDSLDKQFFKESDTSTHCPWKGDAKYLTIEVDGKVNDDAAWYYPSPKDGAKEIADRVAFWRGVSIE